MKKICLALTLAVCALVSKVYAISTNDIQLWTGSGTNHAALVIEWNSPVVFGVTEGSLSYDASAFTNGCLLNPSTNFNVDDLTYILERSLDLVNWTPVSTSTPANTQTVTLQDPAQPASQAFYRLAIHP